MELAAGTHLAPAKINLALHVTGRRPDRYHTLSSLVAFATVGDRLTLEPAEADGFALEGPFAATLRESFTPGAPNSVLEALARMRVVARRHGRTIAPARITLAKHLPVASGIGGGSADAAALVRAAVAACPDLAVDFREAAEALGADVPMCVDCRAACVSGIGKTIEPVGDFPTIPAVLVNPGVPVSTPAVFRALEHRDNPPMPELPTFTGIHDVLEFLHATRNDLEPPAIRIAPTIAVATAALRYAGASFARMSGSGATVFGLFESDGAAGRAVGAIKDRHPGWWVAATSLGSVATGGSA
ncbi:4-(cytidine 5'-diphospho)-2-C-methyl-D-erythritol kinase [Aureimonas leprariae]|uniref:4-diphosphocytidyl-2-C-methyl-D-erythritol kinase n=1 Tax=Plantimonas leprariae TaxID=2615207 RepID=A0A7V7TX71_9HYPH|nr:4-(cytidine 5'-diphospho)-2-C-methyl-D-erythritol kinase [Aureimonas leprariae]